MAEDSAVNDTIFRADSLPTEQEQEAGEADDNVPARPSIVMKKPTADFNAVGP